MSFGAMRARGEAWRSAWRLSRLVRERARFSVHEARRTARPRRYRLRGLGATALVRHHLGDAFVLDEVVGSEAYALPEPVRERLTAPGDARVVDLGGHLGYFGLTILALLPGAHVVSFEPDPENARLLRRCVELGGHAPNWTVVEACAAPKDARAGFVSGRGAMSHLPENGAEPTVEVDTRDVFPYLRGARLLKLDIEGGEWDLLADARLAAAAPPTLVMEYHRHRCPVPDARGLATERLRELGYTVRHSENDLGDPPRVGMLWAWRDA